MMQRMESGVMIGRIAARLLREHPHLPILTVHDSIVVQPDARGLVEAVIAEEWQAEFGVTPGTKATMFTAAVAPPKKKKRKKRKRLQSPRSLRTHRRPRPGWRRDDPLL